MNSKFWQIISRNADASIELSTVRLPSFSHDAWPYESCLFVKQDSEVLCRYASLDEAVLGHNKLAKQYGLKY
jgi:hypothetical protein